MKTIFTSRKNRRLAALGLATALVVSALAIGLSSTLASKNPVVGDFTQQPNDYRTVEAGKTVTTNVIGAAYVSSANTAIATTPGGKILGQPVQVTGVAAGVATISIGSTAGLVAGVNYQVYDDNNIVKYTIPNGAEVLFSAAGQSAASPVAVETGLNTPASNSAAFNRIEWESLQPAVAGVHPDTGAITAVSKGMAAVLGRFADKWGVRQTLVILVGVELDLDGGPTPASDHLVINQAYGSGPLDGSGSVSHSFVELYNPTDSAISLAGCSLQIQNGSDASNAATEWVKYDFGGGASVAPYSSFLIRLDATNPLTTVRYIIPDADVDWTGGRVMSNRAYSVALVENQTLLSKNITSGEMANVIDLVGATNTAGQDTTLNYLGTPVDGMSKQKPIRRVNFRNTGNNSADFETLDYRASGIGNDRLGEVRPRWSGDGAWGGEGPRMVKQNVSHQIKTGNDDLHASATAVTLAGTSLQLSGLSGTTGVTNYLRFPGIDLPEDAVITGAYIAFTARTASSSPTSFTVRGELGAGAPFTSSISSVNGRVLSSAGVTCQTPASVTAGMVFQTGNLSAVVAEMREHYGGGVQDYVFQLEGSKTGAFAAQSYEGSQSAAPKLFIEYVSGYGKFIGSSNSLNDSAEEYGTGHAINLNSRLEIGGYLNTTLTPASKLVVGLRFPDVTIPADAEITQAYVEFTVDTAAAGRYSNMVIRAEMGNPAAYAATAYNVSNRTYGTLSVQYQSSFLTGLEKVRTANLRSIIDETRLNGWQSGQALAFMIDGDNYIGNVAQSGVANAPRLVVQYKFSGMGPYIEGAITNAAEMAGIFINEVSAEGTKASKESWVELYNANDVPVVLGKGTYLSNSSALTSFQFGGLLIPAKGFRAVYCDGLTAQGKDHASFTLKSAGTVTLAAADAKGAVKAIDSLAYGGHLYNQTYGRVPDGNADTALFQGESFGKSNSLGQLNYQVSVSRGRGVYDAGFNLTITASNPGAQIKYSVDGVTTPDQSKGLAYNGPIAITKSCVVKIYAYDQAGNSGLQAYTYVLKDNLKNEVASGAQWQYKNSITGDEYAKAMSCFPIVSVTTNSGSNLSSSATADYVQSTVEYIDAHLGKGDNNHFSAAGAKKFGQVSITQYNSGVSFKYHRDYGTKKSKNQYFDPIPYDKFPTPQKYGKMQLKEGQDGPQADIYNLGYLRYSDSVVHTLGIQMGKFEPKTRFVQYFFNGKYYGLKTLREAFSDGMFENYFGDDSENYTTINFQDAYYATGTVLSGDGNPALLTAIKKTVTDKNFQEFKKYVDVTDYIKHHILFLFIDCETEAEGIVHNDAYTGGGVKMITNINDLDGAFHNNGMTGTAGYAYAGGGGTYRYKWSLGACRRGPGGWFGAFSGDSSINPTAGNLEFKTLVKDQVLAQIGPAGGTWAGAPGAPLSVDNVRGLIQENFSQLNNNCAYKVDAAYMGARSTIYQDWLNMQAKVHSQMTDRVRYSLEMWLAYGMAHTLGPVTFTASGANVTLGNPNGGTDVYYTADGTDPMGPDGVISGAAVKYAAGTVLPASAKLTVRPYKANNWGPISAWR